MRVGTSGRERAGRDPEADLRRAVELDPDYSEAWVNLAGVLLSRWDFEGAVVPPPDGSPGVAVQYSVPIGGP